MQEVLDETPVEVDEPHKGLDLGHTPWGWPVTNTSHLNGIHFHATFREDEAEILYCGLSAVDKGMRAHEMWPQVEGMAWACAAMEEGARVHEMWPRVQARHRQGHAAVNGWCG